MAIIRSNSETDIKSGQLSVTDQHPPIILDLEKREFIWPADYKVVAIVGDSYSQELRFQVPREYDGVSLDGTSCILTYWTSWTDDKGHHSKGSINLGEPTEDSTDTDLIYRWTLNKFQTARPGICKFSIGFYLNLDDDFYYEYPDINNLIFEVQNNAVSIKLVDKITNEEGEENADIIPIDHYYALISNSGMFTIMDNGIGEGENINFKSYEERLEQVEHKTTSLEEKTTSLENKTEPLKIPTYSPTSVILSQAEDNIAGSAGFEWVKVSKNKNGSGYDYICAENSKSELSKLKEAWVQAKELDNRNYYLSFYAVNPNSGEQKETSHRSDGNFYIKDIDPDNCIIKADGYYDGWTPEDGSNNGWKPVYEGDYSKLGQGSTIRAIDFPTIGTIEAVEYAVSMGHNNKVIGDASVGLGKNNIVNGSYAFAAGRDNYVGYNGTSFGRRNKVKGQMGMALGQENEILGHNDSAIGSGLKDNGSSANQLMAGRYNTPDAEALFIVGNGNSDADRSNAFIVKENGDAKVKKDLEVNGSATIKGAVTIEQGIKENLSVEKNIFAKDSVIEGSDLYVWDGTIATEFAEGNGTEDAPYIIKTPEQFAYMVENFGFNGSYFSIVNDLYFNDITLDKNNWTNTDWYGQKKNNSSSNYVYENTLDVQGTFVGNINGNGHSIYGIYHISKTDEDKYYYTVGLIPTMGNGYIKNLAIKNSHFYGVGGIGGFIGKCARTAYTGGIINIENCYVNHDVTLYCNAKGNAGVGGIIGYAVTQKVEIINCYSLTSNISSWDGLKGGLVGNGWGSPYYLTQCYSIYQPYPLDNPNRKPIESTSVYSNAKNVSSDNTITGLWTVISNENMQGLDALDKDNPNKMSGLGSAFQATSYYPQLKSFFNNMREDDINKMYIGSGELPDGFDIQFDPEGEIFEIDEKFDPNSLNPQSGKAVAEGLNLAANAVRTTARGTNITLNDISPFKHNIALKVEAPMLFEPTDFGYLRSTPFVLTEGNYAISIEVTDQNKWYEWVLTDSSWAANASPQWHGNDLSATFSTATNTREYCLFLGTHNGLTPEDVVSCTIVNTTTGGTAFPIETDLLSITVNVVDDNGKVTTYKPNSDGIVEGIGSEYPTMSITNSIGAEMVCEYNRDLNKAIPIVDQTYTPESTNAQSGIAVAEAFALKDFELIIDTTITESIAEIVWEKDDNGNPLTDYSAFFLYFVGKFDADATGVFSARFNDGGLYIMWKDGYAKKATAVRGFWHYTERIAKVDNQQYWKSHYPKALLGNMNENGINTQGLSENNRELLSDLSVSTNTDVQFPLKYHFASAGVNFSAGSRFLLFGRKA